MANRSLLAKFEVISSLRPDAIVFTTDGRTDRHSLNDLEFPKNLGSQNNISMCPTRTDKTNIPSMSRV